MKALPFDASRFGYWTPRRRLALARLALLVGTYGTLAVWAVLAVGGLLA